VALKSVLEIIVRRCLGKSLNTRGSTLIELIMAIAINTILVSSVYQFININNSMEFRSRRTADARVEIQRCLFSVLQSFRRSSAVIADGSTIRVVGKDATDTLTLKYSEHTVELDTTVIFQGELARLDEIVFVGKELPGCIIHRVS
jgi:hypothetical protein